MHIQCTFVYTTHEHFLTQVGIYFTFYTVLSNIVWSSLHTSAVALPLFSWMYSSPSVGCIIICLTMSTYYQIILFTYFDSISYPTINISWTYVFACLPFHILFLVCLIFSSSLRPYDGYFMCQLEWAKRRPPTWWIIILGSVCEWVSRRD